MWQNHTQHNSNVCMALNWSSCTGNHGQFVHICKPFMMWRDRHAKASRLFFPGPPWDWWCVYVHVVLMLEIYGQFYFNWISVHEVWLWTVHGMAFDEQRLQTEHLQVEGLVREAIFSSQDLKLLLSPIFCALPGWLLTYWSCIFFTSVCMISSAPEHYIFTALSPFHHECWSPACPTKNMQHDGKQMDAW